MSLFRRKVVAARKKKQTVLFSEEKKAQIKGERKDNKLILLTS